MALVLPCIVQKSKPMKTVHLFLLLGGLTVAQIGLAQDRSGSEKPNQCVAAFVGNRMVVDQYTTTGKCRLSATATGDLAVYTVHLSPTESKALDKIDFQVAIRDKQTGTLTMYSAKQYRQVPVQEVLTKCRKGDQIVLMTVDNRYALPHNEILVQ